MWHPQSGFVFTLLLFPSFVDALVSLRQFWIDDMGFSVDLLKQFLEDMDAYTNVSGCSGVFVALHDS